MHIDPETGAPIFVLEQMMMAGKINDVYQRYGIHGIYYTVLYGWAASPFASVTDPEARHDIVSAEVYGRTYYDPIRQDEVLMEKSRVPQQYQKKDIIAAIELINKLARVPIIEEKIAYLKWLDTNTKAMNAKAHADNPKGELDQAKNQGELLKHRNVLNSGLDNVMNREKDILTKKDPMCSLDDFITAIQPNA